MAGDMGPPRKGYGEQVQSYRSDRQAQEANDFCSLTLGFGPLSAFCAAFWAIGVARGVAV